MENSSLVCAAVAITAARMLMAAIGSTVSMNKIIPLKAFPDIFSIYRIGGGGKRKNRPIPFLMLWYTKGARYFSAH